MIVFGELFKYTGFVRLTDSESYFAIVSIAGHSDIFVPRSSCHLLYMIPDSNNLVWYTIDTSGGHYLGLRQVGIYVRNHLDVNGHLSVQALVSSTTTTATTTTTTTTTNASVMSPAVDRSEGEPEVKRRKSSLTMSDNDSDDNSRGEVNGVVVDHDNVININVAENNAPNANDSVNNIDVAIEITGFPENAPFRVQPPDNFYWQYQYRNLGTPASRQRDHRAGIFLVPLTRGPDGRVPIIQYRAREENEEKEICGIVVI